MSEDLQSQRYYVLERIGELREQIPQAMQAVIPMTHSAASAMI